MTRRCATLDLAAAPATRTAVESDPSAGAGGFETVSGWEDPARGRTTARSFGDRNRRADPVVGEVHIRSNALGARLRPP